MVGIFRGVKTFANFVVSGQFPKVLNAKIWRVIIFDNGNSIGIMDVASLSLTRQYLPNSSFLNHHVDTKNSHYMVLSQKKTTPKKSSPKHHCQHHLKKNTIPKQVFTTQVHLRPCKACICHDWQPLAQNGHPCVSIGKCIAMCLSMS